MMAFVFCFVYLFVILMHKTCSITSAGSERQLSEPLLGAALQKDAMCKALLKKR